MKKIFSAFAAAVIAASAVTANASELFASYLYNDTPVQEASLYCVVGLADDPLAKYDYAKQNGVDEFVFTDEGKAVYEDLMSDHLTACQTMSDSFGREVQKVYDYTSVYNGFAVILKETEYNNIYLNPKNYGVKQIYATGYATEIPDNIQQRNVSESYKDLTDKILEQTGVSKVSQKGDSIVIAVIDDSFDTEHEFLSTMPEGVTGVLSEDYINGVSAFLSSTSGGGSGYYLNEKIPYRFDYTNHNTNTDDPAEFHGTHVAGIAAGNGAAETDEKYDAKGVAPDAQLVLMSSNLSGNDLMAAYNDCAYLGVDTVNASYGVAYVPAMSEPYASEAISNLTATGTMFCAAAGNDAKISYTGADSLLNTDYATGGTPDGVSSAFSVGSAENLVFESKIITVGGKNYQLSPGTSDITAYFGDTDKEFVAVPGLGYPEDFEGLNLKGKIALIQRGELTFDEKAQNAKDNGAVGVIIYNNVPGESSFTPGCSVLPAGMISYEDGMEIIGSGETTVTISSESKLISSLTSKMSDFSTWGYTEQLLLKPDITAYGGNIISSYPDNEYSALSGTSMASPQITGITALLKEYLKQNTEKYGIVSEADYPEMMAKLLMSTATPVYSSDNVEIASPRVQGSGLVNVESAMNTPAYLYTDSAKDCYRPKISLGDNLESNIGSLEFSSEKFYFHIKNISDTAQTYTLSADLFCDSTTEDGELAANVMKMTESKVLFKYGMTEINEITVAPGEDVIVSLDIDLSTEEQEYIAETFENGTFIDGYVYLKSDSAPNLTLPFMGYYGSWSDSDIFEPFVYNSKKNASYSPSIMADANNNIAGVNNIAAVFGEQITAIPVYSPNGDNVLDNINLYLGFKRRCYNVTAEIYLKGKRVYTELITADVGSWIPEDGMISNMQYPINWDFAGVSDGELYELRLTAETPDTGNGFRREVLSQEFRIDTTAPEVKECRKIFINGEEYVQLTITDNLAVQGAVLLEEDFSEDVPMVIDSGYCQTTTEKEYSVTLQVPEDSDTYSAEVYDMAGNCTSVDLNKAVDTYYLSYDENMFFSTNDKTFKNKISLTDSNGNNVTFGVSLTPEKAYKEKYGVISVIMNSDEIAQIPVTVGLAGDADVNEVTNLYDAIKIAKYILWQNDPNGPFKNEFKDFEGSFGAYLADYDVNGTINLYDAVGIAKLLLPAGK